MSLKLIEVRCGECGAVMERSAWVWCVDDRPCCGRCIRQMAPTFLEWGITLTEKIVAARRAGLRAASLN
jgi:hypothetical protein